MIFHKKASVRRKRLTCAFLKGEGKLLQAGVACDTLVVRPNKMRRLFLRLILKSNSIPLSDSPQLLCSGAVLRYQFKPYLKPDSTHPRALSWSHYWHLAVSLLWAEGTYHIRLVYIPSSGKGGIYV